MSKIYTRKGDEGLTSIKSGRVKKTNEVIQLLGFIDDLQSSIGFLIFYCKDQNSFMLQRIQKNLMSIMSIVSGYDVKDIDLEQQTNELEIHIDIITRKLPKLSNFILSGFGHNHLELFAHQARTKCRIVESHMYDGIGNSPIKKYINRLSDYLFTLCREYNTNEKAFSIKRQSIV